jgi:hypothetical protein
MSTGSTVNPEQVLGVTVCTNCRKRFRIAKKYEAVLGKSVKCSACHQPFVVNLEPPSQVEQAAIQNAEQKAAEQQQSNEGNGAGTTKKKKKTKSEIRKEYIDRIRDNLKVLHKELVEITENCSSEEQIRIWCVNVLKTVLEYDSNQIDTEVLALGQRIDIALKDDDRIFMIIECKNTRSKLSSAVRDQAVMYAINKSAEWAVTTNGPIWKLWRVIPRKGLDPQVEPVFDISLLDEDGISEADLSNFYLLTKRALFNGETLREFHRKNASNDQHILQAILSPRVVEAVVKSLTESYQTTHDERVSLTTEYIAERLEEMFLPDEL